MTGHPTSYGLPMPWRERLEFPPPGTAVTLAVSGGPDSVGLALLAHAAGLQITVHHVDHHLRPDSDRDAALVRELASSLGVPCQVHDVAVDPSRGVEAGARAARRAVLPPGVLTGHTMDDLAETMLLNLLRGAGLDGLSPHVRSGTTPLLRVRRADVRQFVEESGQPFILDPTNDDRSLRRNKVRHDVIPLLSESADRDIVPVLARQAFLLADEREWLDHATAPDRQVTLETADCRELATWPAVRLRRWLRHVLTAADVDGTHPPSAAEVARAERVVRGEVTACELSGGRRFARSSQRLSLQ